MPSRPMPQSLDTIVATNLHADILSDLAAAGIVEAYDENGAYDLTKAGYELSHKVCADSATHKPPPIPFTSPTKS